MAVVNHPDPPHNFRDGDGNVDWTAGEQDDLEAYITGQGPEFADAVAQADADYDAGPAMTYDEYLRQKAHGVICGAIDSYRDGQWHTTLGDVNRDELADRIVDALASALSPT